MTTFRITPSASDPGTFEFSFANPKCSRWGRCIINVVEGEPRGSYHGWNGDADKPTIKPSIGCESRGCTWHGFITNGELTP